MKEISDTESAYREAFEQGWHEKGLYRDGVKHKDVDACWQDSKAKAKDLEKEHD